MHTDVSSSVGQGLQGAGDNANTLTDGVPCVTHPQLISRGADMMEDMKRVVPNGTSAATGSNGLTGAKRNTSTEQ